MSDVRLLDEFFTERQLAEQLGKSVRQVMRLREQRKSPPWKKVGQTILYPREDTRRWLHSGLTNPIKR
jgi:hypothetical protein